MSSSFKVSVTYSLHMCKNMLSRVNLAKIEKTYVVSRKLTDNDILGLEKFLESMDWFLLTEDRIAVSTDDILMRIIKLGATIIYDKSSEFYVSIHKLKFELLLFMPHSTIEKPIVINIAENTITSCCTDRIYYKSEVTGGKEHLPYIDFQFPMSRYNGCVLSMYIHDVGREVNEYTPPLIRFLQCYCPKFLGTISNLPTKFIEKRDSLAENDGMIIYVKGRLKKLPRD